MIAFQANLFPAKQICSPPVIICVDKCCAAFEHEGPIPNEYLADDDNISPPLEFVGVPPNTKSFAIIVDDPDADKGQGNHWIMYNIPETMTTVSCTAASRADSRRRS